MNRTREWVSTHSIEDPSYEMLSKELEHSIPQWLARIEISSINDDESMEWNTAMEWNTPMEIEYPKFASKLG